MPEPHLPPGARPLGSPPGRPRRVAAPAWSRWLLLVALVAAWPGTAYPQIQLSTHGVVYDGPEDNLATLLLVDLDGDGRDDVLTSGPGLVVMRSLGSDGFAPAVYYPGGQGGPLATGDFNEDGVLDVVLGSARSTGGYFFAGVPGGTFAPAVSIALGDHPGRIVAGDFNGDGHLDVVATTTGNPTFLPGRGNGTFFPGRAVTTDGVIRNAVAAGDLNGDGRDDVVLGSTTGFSDVFTANSSGFDPGLRLGTLGRSAAIWIIDVQGDSAPEIVLASRDTATVQITGFDPINRTFGPTTYAPVDGVGWSPLSGSRDMVMPDVNGDGRPDLVALSFDYRVSVRSSAGAGAGAFEAAITAPSVLGTLEEGGGAIGVGDVDGDGDQDIVTAVDGAISVLPRRDDGRYDPPWAVPIPAANGIGFAAGDLNLDGVTDLAAHGPSQLTLVLSQPGGGFVTQTLPSPHPSAWLRIADMNLDGKPDLVLAGQENAAQTRVSVWLGDGAGGFTVAKSTVYNISPCWNAVVCDLNEDSKPDIVIGLYGSAANLYWFAGQGNGQFTSQGTFATSLPDFDGEFAVRDFDQDGHVDVLALDSYGGKLSLRRGLGGGAYGAAAFPATVPGASTLRAGDLNGDGKLDLALVGMLTQELQVMLGDGAGGFSWGGHFPVGERPGDAELADLDGDSIVDIVTANSFDYSVSVLRGIGGGAFDAAKDYLGAFGAGAVEVGDFDHDGRTDVAVLGSAIVALLRNTTIPLAVLQVDAGRIALRVWPNPVGDRVRVAFALQAGKPASLELFDLAGRRVWGRTFDAAGGDERTVEFARPNGLAPGVYAMRLRQGDVERTAKVMVLK